MVGLGVAHRQGMVARYSQPHLGWLVGHPRARGWRQVTLGLWDGCAGHPKWRQGWRAATPGAWERRQATQRWLAPPLGVARKPPPPPFSFFLNKK